MKNKIFEIIICVLLVAVLSLQVVTLVKLYATPEKQADVTENSQGDIDLSVVQIHTAYCTMLYPSEWMDYLKFEEKTESGIYSAIFSCEINGKKCELFTVTFGAEDSENSIGTIKNNGKEIPVAIKTAQLDKSAWTTEEYKIVSEMQSAKSKVKESILAHEDIA